MNITMMRAFTAELEKRASLKYELAGLGMLAAPTLKKRITKKEPSEGFKDTAEIGGLGTLAYGAYRASKAAITKRAMIAKVATDLWDFDSDATSEPRLLGKALSVLGHK